MASSLVKKGFQDAEDAQLLSEQTENTTEGGPLDLLQVVLD
jgi:hypothetical protein